MDPELVRMFRAAQRALEQGADSSKINAHIARLTDGRFTNLDALRQAAALEAAAGDSEPTQAEDRPGFLERVGGLATAAAQGITFGLTDEISGAARALGALVPGGQSPGEAYRAGRDEERQRLDAIRQDMPIASTVAEIGGGLLVPGAGTAGAARTGTTAGRAIGRAALAGGASGAAYAAGSADEDRGRAAIGGGLLGSALSAGGTAAVRGVRAGVRALRDPLRREAAEVGETLAGRLREGTGLQGETAPVRREAQERASAVFRDLDALQEIDHPGLRSVLSQEDVARLGGVRAEVAQGSQAPSFRDAQSAFRRIRDVRDKARKSADVASFDKAARMVEDLSSALDDATDGRWSKANPEFAREMRAVRAVRDGYRAMSGGAGEFEAAFEALDDPAARIAFREGAAARIAQMLEKGNVNAMIRNSRTREFRRRLSIVFDGDTDAMNAWLDDIQSAKPGSRAKAMKQLRQWAFRGAAAGAGFGAAQSLFDIF